MCLAIPGKIVSIDEGGLANVDIMGIERQTSLDLVPDAKIGDYVLVHAGFAIEIIPEDSVSESIDLITELMDAAGVDALDAVGDGNTGNDGNVAARTITPNESASKVGI